MNARFEQLPCPTCGDAVVCELFPLVDAARDSSLRDRLFANKLAALTCPNCGHEAPIAHDLVYLDASRRLAVRLALDEAFDPTQPDLSRIELPPLEEGVARRIVHSRNELLEKILLAEAGFDDRVIEALKASLGADNPELEDYEARFHGLGAGGTDLVFAALGGGLEKSFAVPRAAVDELTAELCAAGLVEGEGSEWIRVDGAFGAELMERLG